MIFKVYSDFFMYKSGIYSRTPDASLPKNSNMSFFHSVKVIGWNKSDDNIPYWVNRLSLSYGHFYFISIKMRNHMTI